MSEPSKLTYLLITAICIFYVVSLFLGLTDSCLWFDEIFSIHAAEHSWPDLFRFVSLDLIHPPLFYALLKIWIAVGGESISWLRGLPVLFGILSLIPFFGLIRELKLDKTVAILSLLFLTVNGSVLKYSLELRMYSLLMCISVFSIWIFARYYFKGKSFWLLVFINILLVWTHYFGWFVVLSEVVLIIWFQRTKWRRISMMLCVTLLSFLPWAIAVLSVSQSGTGLSQNIGWMQRPGLSAIAQLILNLIEPFYFQTANIEPMSIFRVSIPILLIVLISIAAYFKDSLKDENGHQRERTFFLLAFTIFPLFLVFVASWLLPYSIWGTRHLIIAFVPFFLFAAMTVASISMRWLRIASITLLILFIGYAFIHKTSATEPQYSWCAWEPLTAQAFSEKNEKIYAAEDLIAYHSWFSLRSKRDAQVFRLTGIDGLMEDKAYFLPRGFDGVKTKDLREVEGQRLWLMYRAGSINLNEPPLRNFVVAGYKIADSKKITAADASAIAVLLEK